MTTFLLVHGAFHGAWCWARVTPLLEAAGHRVIAIDQTGLGARAHLLDPGITLTTFADDVVQALESDDLQDVVLVGHSFGGNAISGAADRVPQRIRHLVYLDGSCPEAASRRSTWRCPRSPPNAGPAPPQPATSRSRPPSPPASACRTGPTPTGSAPISSRTPSAA